MRIILSHGVCGHAYFSSQVGVALFDASSTRLRKVTQLVAGHVSFGANASRGTLSLLVSVSNSLPNIGCHVEWCVSL